MATAGVEVPDAGFGEAAVFTGLAEAEPRLDTSPMTPGIRYARSGEVSIAYQVVGDGPFDLVWTPGALSNLGFTWEDEAGARFLRALASFSRLIIFDKRGTGLSDRVAGVADLETRMDDIRAVMDAAGSETAAVCGVSEGGPMASLFAATYTERVRTLVIYGSLPRFVRGPNFPWAKPRHEYLAECEAEAAAWGTEENAREWLEAQGLETTPEAVRERARRDQMAISPGALLQLGRMNAEIDVRPILSTIRVPTLVLHRAEDPIPIEGARWTAEQIPGARFVELPGGSHVPYYGDWESVVVAIREFVEPICLESARPYDGVLATVLFTDLVGSTAKAVELGDRAWRELLEQHHARTRAELSRFRGVELDTAGDGFFARFDGPARAIRCACAVRDSVSDLGLEVRAGLHTGECEVMDGKVAGIAVSIGARVAARAGPGEVFVSQTVKDLVAGSGIEFEDRGGAELKGVPGEWRLYSVAAA
ncbi:MAG TPA: adenylate/guanylate cyclase domain-containing protein [Gaiellaceae bacterium]|nr:adenylate/guanylate cyclase domain-containing protein [Gaiellaceae bacterium]